MEPMPPRSSSPRTLAPDHERLPSPPEITAAWRIVDANLNRCLEGLRVIEEYLRFALDDAYLARLSKQLRHDLARWAAQLPVEQLHRARDTVHDVGTHLTTAGEYHRPSLRAVAAAGCKRVQQALRSLEEYVKLVAPDSAAAVEAIRYRAYLLERAITVTQSSCARLAQARLYVLVDGRESLEAFIPVAQAVVRGGADVVQLRDKRLSDRELCDRARVLRELTRQEHALLIINDRPDLAVLVDADGVHLGQDDLPAAAARRIVGPDRLIGVSTHNVVQARQAVLEGADYLGCGPTFPSRTKNFDHCAGLEFLAQVQAELRLPAFAIGGIDEHNLAAVLATGMCRTAVQSAVLDADDVGRATHRLHMLLTRTNRPPSQG